VTGRTASTKVGSALPDSLQWKLDEIGWQLALAYLAAHHNGGHQDELIAVGAIRLKPPQILWALGGSNTRPQRCQRCALTS
jgi:hypothetical protein